MTLRVDKVKPGSDGMLLARLSLPTTLRFIRFIMYGGNLRFGVSSDQK